MDEIYYTVDEITEEIASRLEGDPYLDDVWIVGEVSGARSRKNHLYFNLLGERSKIQCVFFGRGWVDLEEGEILEVRGSVGVYREGGFYSFRVSEIRRTGLRGMKKLELMKTYERLAKEGIFQKPKKELPAFPYRIGLITSKTSAAVMDILRTFREKGTYFLVEIFHTGVQGEEAVEEILNALKEASERDLDAVIIARGGGDKEDLGVFNDERIVRAAALFPHFLITGIGHEIDTVLLDLVADRSAHTPTAAAEVITKRQEEFAGKIDEIIERIRESVEWLIEGAESDLKERLQRISRGILWNLNVFEEKLDGIFGKIEGLSHESILERGFALVLKEGKLVKSAKEISKGDELIIVMKDGRVKVVVV